MDGNCHGRKFIFMCLVITGAMLCGGVSNIVSVHNDLLDACTLALFSLSKVTSIAGRTKTRGVSVSEVHLNKGVLVLH